MTTTTKTKTTTTNDYFAKQQPGPSKPWRGSRRTWAAMKGLKIVLGIFQDDMVVHNNILRISYENNQDDMVDHHETHIAPCRLASQAFAARCPSQSASRPPEWKTSPGRTP